MDIKSRIDMVELLIHSVKESVEEYKGNRYGAGYDYAREHSAGSIQERCKIARRELLMIMKELS